MAKKGKTYRTASGKNVDFGAMLLANETESALGNMNVNARGDQISSDGKITKTREEVMREYNSLHTMVPTDSDIPEGTPVVPDDDWQDWEPPVPHESAVEEVAPIIEKIVERDKEVLEQLSDTPVEEPTTKEGPRSLGHVIEEEHAVQQQEKTPAGGLAAAVARAKNVNTKDSIQQPKHVEEQNIKGVRRI